MLAVMLLAVMFFSERCLSIYFHSRYIGVADRIQNGFLVFCNLLYSVLLDDGLLDSYVYPWFNCDCN